MINFFKLLFVGRKARRIREEYRRVCDASFEFMDSQVMFTPKEVLWESPEYRAMREEEIRLEQRYRDLTGKRIWVSDEEWKQMEQEGTKEKFLLMYEQGLGDVVQGSSVHAPLIDLVEGGIGK